MLRHAVIAGLARGRLHRPRHRHRPDADRAASRCANSTAAGGIQITASHNPSPWNGLKMFGADGAVLSAEKGAVVRGLYESSDFARAKWDGIGKTQPPPDVLADHARAVLDTVSVAGVAARGFKVFLDANGGAGGPLGSQLLHDLGCAVVQYECDPTGQLRPRTRADPRAPHGGRPVGAAEPSRPSASSSTPTPTDSRSSTRPARA